MSTVAQNTIATSNRTEARFYSLLCSWSGCADPLRFIWQVLNSQPATDSAQHSLWLVPSATQPGQFYRVDIEARVCTCDGFRFRHHCSHIRVADRAAELKCGTAKFASE